MAEAKTSTRPLPSGWTDSSDDGDNPNGAPAAGRGFDDNSSDGDWGGAGGGRAGGGMRQFEQSSAENTRRALLENDGQLCEPPSLSSRQELGVLHVGGNDGGGGGGGKLEGGGPGHGPSLLSSPPLPLSLRYVPGDPFANEEADVEAWAEHFTYLSVVPAGEARGGSGRKDGGCDTDGGGGGGELSESGPTSRRRPDAGRVFQAVGALDVMETEEQESETGGGSKATERCAQEGGAGAQRVTLAAAALEAAGNGQGERRRWDRPQRDEVGEKEEVFASHGVYEEYLAYDCRPPEDDSYTHHDPLGSSGGGVPDAGDRGLTGQGDVEGSFIDVVEQGARAAGAGGRPPAAAATAAKETSGLDTPRRELRQEIMDRLFDELWARLTPDLVSQLDQQPQQPRVAPDAYRDMESEKMEEEVGAGFRLTAPPNNMKD